MKKINLPLDQCETIEEFLTRFLAPDFTEPVRAIHIEAMNDPVYTLEKGPEMMPALCDLLERTYQASLKLNLDYGTKPWYLLLLIPLHSRKKIFPTWNPIFLNRIGEHTTPPELFLIQSFHNLTAGESYFKTIDVGHKGDFKAYFTCSIPANYDVEDEGGYFPDILLVHNKILGSDSSHNLAMCSGLNLTDLHVT